MICRDLDYTRLRACLTQEILDYIFPGLSVDSRLHDSGTPMEFDSQRMERILREFGRIQREFGLTMEEFERILDYSSKPGRLHIARDGRITLPDFGGRQVRLDTLSLSIYILFLRHAEGIDYKGIGDYRNELEQIYGSLSRRHDWQRSARSLDLLCNSMESNSLNEKVSRIKRAFIAAVDERIARHYYIQGTAGTVHRISLDRSLVTIEKFISSDFQEGLSER